MATHKQSSAFDSFTSLVTMLDLFGHPVTLKARGSPSFKSMLGGFTTLIVFALVLAQFAYLCNQTLRREIYQIVSSTSRRDLNFDNTTLILTKDNFDIAFYPFFQSGQGEVTLDNFEDYFSVKIMQNYFFFSGAGMEGTRIP